MNLNFQWVQLKSCNLRLLATGPTSLQVQLLNTLIHNTIYLYTLPLCNSVHNFLISNGSCSSYLGRLPQKHFFSFKQRKLTYFKSGSISVWLTSCLTGLDLTKQVNPLFFNIIKAAESTQIKRRSTVPTPTVILPLTKWVFYALKFVPKRVGTSVTRFGEILSPLWINFKSIVQIFFGFIM